MAPHAVARRTPRSVGRREAQEPAAPLAAKKEGLPPFLGLWKSRLPLVIVPVLAAFQRLSVRQVPPGASQSPQPWELLVLLGIAVSTGALRLPFSVTWWAVLLAAFALETPLLVGAAVVLSVSLLVGWYGLRLQHPQAVSALWGGTRAKEEIVHGSPRWACWQAWDIFVHLLPAALVLWWHGPPLFSSAGHGEPLRSGAVGLSAALAVLPMNVFWLWGLGTMGMPKQKPRLRLWPICGGIRLKDTNVAYCVAPELPEDAWMWVYGSHWCVCALWAAAMLLPSDVAVALSIFAFFGAIRQPYTGAWWTLFLAALSTRWPLLQGMACCCGATTSIGFYGTQLLEPYVFKSLMWAWIEKPAQKLGPRWLGDMFAIALESPYFMFALHVGDLFVHLIPTSLAVLWFWRSVTFQAALVSLPTNLLYLAATRYRTLAATNAIYGVDPMLPDYVWSFIYCSHWLLCVTVMVVCSVLQP